MSTLIRQKQERIIEAVRRGLEGMHAVEFIQAAGYAMDPAGIARNLRQMGGRGRIQQLIGMGKSNREIMQELFPREDFAEVNFPPPLQEDLFAPEEAFVSADAGTHDEQFETTRFSLRLPTDLYEAIRLAARAEGKTRQDLVIEILTQALSNMPRKWPPEGQTREKA